MAPPRSSVSSTFSNADGVLPSDFLKQHVSERQLRKISMSSDNLDDDISSNASNARPSDHPIESVPIHNTFLNIVSQPAPLYVKSLSMPEELLSSEDVTQLLDGSRISRQVDALFFKPRRPTGRRQSESSNKLLLERVPEVSSQETTTTELEESSPVDELVDSLQMLSLEDEETRTPAGSLSITDTKTPASLSHPSPRTKCPAYTSSQLGHQAAESTLATQCQFVSSFDKPIQQVEQYPPRLVNSTPVEMSDSGRAPSANQAPLLAGRMYDKLSVGSSKHNPLEYLTLRNKRLGMASSLEYPLSPIQGPTMSFSKSRSPEAYETRAYDDAQCSMIRHLSKELDTNDDDRPWFCPLRRPAERRGIGNLTIDSFGMGKLMQGGPTLATNEAQSSQLAAELSQFMGGANSAFISQLAAKNRGSIIPTAPPGSCAEDASEKAVKDINMAAFLNNVATVTMPANCDADVKNAIPLEDLTPELIAKIPRNENGDFLSFGSIGHTNGTCKACVFFHNPAKGCKNGLRCLFCHFPHAPKKRVRLSKKKRAEAKMLHQESSMPLYSQSNSHTLLETLGSGQHGCQLQESNSTLANCSNGTGSIFLCQQQAAGLNRSDLSSRRNPPSLPLSFLKTYAKRNAYVPSELDCNQQDRQLRHSLKRNEDPFESAGHTQNTYRKEALKTLSGSLPIGDSFSAGSSPAFQRSLSGQMPPMRPSASRPLKASNSSDLGHRSFAQKSSLWDIDSHRSDRNVPIPTRDLNIFHPAFAPSEEWSDRTNGFFMESRQQQQPFNHSLSSFGPSNCKRTRQLNQLKHGLQQHRFTNSPKPSPNTCQLNGARDSQSHAPLNLSTAGSATLFQAPIQHRSPILPIPPPLQQPSAVDSWPLSPMGDRSPGASSFMKPNSDLRLPFPIGTPLLIVPSSPTTPPTSNLLNANGALTPPCPTTPTCLSPLLFPQPTSSSLGLNSHGSFVFSSRQPCQQFPGSLSPNMIGVQSVNRLLSPMAVASPAPSINGHLTDSSSDMATAGAGSGSTYSHPPAATSTLSASFVSSTPLSGAPFFTCLPPSAKGPPTIPAVPVQVVSLRHSN